MCVRSVAVYNAHIVSVHTRHSPPTRVRTVQLCATASWMELQENRTGLRSCARLEREGHPPCRAAALYTLSAVFGVLRADGGVHKAE